MTWKRFALTFTFAVLVFGQTIFAQSESADVLMQKSELIESSYYVGSEQESAFIDHLRVAMQNNPDSKGAFVFYCGKICSYGEIEAHTRGLSASLKGKGWKDSEFAILQGGYKEKFTLEYWLIPHNSGLPIPNSTIDIINVKFKGTFKKKLVPYDCCNE